MRVELGCASADKGSTGFRAWVVYLSKDEIKEASIGSPGVLSSQAEQRGWQHGLRIRASMSRRGCARSTSRRRSTLERTNLPSQLLELRGRTKGGRHDDVTENPHLSAPDARTAAPSLRDASSSGRIDGAWWPQSRDLRTEAEDLIDNFSAAAGRISRLPSRAQTGTTRSSTVAGFIGSRHDVDVSRSARFRVMTPT